MLFELLLLAVSLSVSVSTTVAALVRSTDCISCMPPLLPGPAFDQSCAQNFNELCEGTRRCLPHRLCLVGLIAGSDVESFIQA